MKNAPILTKNRSVLTGLHSNTLSTDPCTCFRGFVRTLTPCEVCKRWFQLASRFHIEGATHAAN